MLKKRHIHGKLAEARWEEVHTSSYEGRATSRDAAPVRGSGGGRGRRLGKASYSRDGGSERVWMFCRDARTVSSRDKNPCQD
jgi:hypothetical protein